MLLKLNFRESPAPSEYYPRYTYSPDSKLRPSYSPANRLSSCFVKGFVPLFVPSGFSFCTQVLRNSLHAGLGLEAMKASKSCVAPSKSFKTALATPRLSLKFHFSFGLDSSTAKSQ